MKIVKVDEPIAIDAGPGGPAPEPDYVDQIDNGRASVVSPKGDARIVALADLPKGVQEGHYVSGGQIVPAPPDEGAPIRARLAAGDPGGTISLDGPPAAATPAPAAATPGPTVMSPVGQIPASTPGLPPVTDSTAPDIGGAPAAPGSAPGAADAYIDSVINGTAAGAPGAPSGAAPAPGTPGATDGGPAIPKLGPNGLPADSSDLQQRILQGVDAEGKALQGVSDAKAQGQDEIAKAQADRDELRRQQTADLAAQQLYTRERQTKLDQEDAANLQKTQDTVIPEFWEGHEGALVGSAITAGLAGLFGGALAGATGNQVGPNPVLQAIQHSIDAYSQKSKEKVDNLYKYAEQKGLMNDKLRSQYAGELTDLMQQHAYLMQAAADRIGEVSDQSKGLVDQAQTKYLQSQLQGNASELLIKARAIDEKNYDSQTHREIADADMIRANAAAAKAHKGKGGGGGGASGTDYLTAMQHAAQEPGATEASVMAAAKANGYRGKDNQLATMAAKEVANVGKQTEGVDKRMKDFETQLNGPGGKGGPGQQLSRIQAMKKQLSDAATSGDPDRIKAAITAIKEEAGGMLSGGKTTRYTGHMLDEAKSLEDQLKANWSKITGHPTEGAHFTASMQRLLDTVEGEKLQEVHEIRQKAVDEELGPGGKANSPAAKRSALSGFKSLTGQIKDANGNPVYQEGGAKAAVPAAPKEGDTGLNKGRPVVFRGGKWQLQ